MTAWGPAPAGADDGGGCRNSSNLSWVRACDLRCLSNVSVNLSHYLVAFLGASFRLPTMATAPTWVAPSERFTVWGWLTRPRTHAHRGICGCWIGRCRATRAGRLREAATVERMAKVERDNVEGRIRDVFAEAGAGPLGGVHRVVAGGTPGR